MIGSRCGGHGPVKAGPPLNHDRDKFPLIRVHRAALRRSGSFVLCLVKRVKRVNNSNWSNCLTSERLGAASTARIRVIDPSPALHSRQPSAMTCCQRCTLLVRVHRDIPDCLSESTLHVSVEELVSWVYRMGHWPDLPWLGGGGCLHSILGVSSPARARYLLLPIFPATDSEDRIGMFQMFQSLQIIIFLPMK